MPGICSAKEFQDIIRNERYRADRSGQQFSLVVFDIDRSDENHIQMRCLPNILRDRLRLVDRAGWLDNKRISAALPYASVSGGWQLADYVCQAMDDKFALPKCTICTYPATANSEDGEHRDQLHFKDLSPE